MHTNKINNQKITMELGEVRPQDIIIHESNVNCNIGDVCFHSINNKYGILLFNKTYYKLAQHHIFVNDTFGNSHDYRNRVINFIRPGQRVHIFLGKTAYLDELVTFCERLAWIPDCRVTLYIAPDCDIKKFINKDIFPAMWLKIVGIDQSHVQFWCSSKFDYGWNNNTAKIIDKCNPHQSVTIDSKQPVNGVRIINRQDIYGLTREESFFVIGLRSNFMPNHMHSRESILFALCTESSEM